MSSPPDARDFRVDRGDFELSGWRAGSGSPTVLCLHESAASSEIWRPLAAALEDRATLIAPDRRGWGSSGAPPDYRRTTIAEQAADAEAVIEACEAAPLALCGAGIGAIVALELAVERPALVRSAVMIEPPLYSLVPEATEAISADVAAIRRAAALATEGIEQPDPRELARRAAAAALDLYRSGSLAALGAGVERIPGSLAGAEAEGSFALFAEIAAISAWTIPLARLGAIECAATVVVSRTTPPLARAAAEALSARLLGDGLRELTTGELPQLDGAGELAELLA